jgi:hypothetical protein
MGGTISADSQLGHGSVFSFEVPFIRGQVEPPPAGAGRAQASGPRLAGAHLLVVDDSAMNRDLVERALALEGATATLAADGQQAVELLRNKPDGFDAVLMDVQMPVMDGSPPPARSAPSWASPSCPSSPSPPACATTSRPTPAAPAPTTCCPSRWTSTRWPACWRAG